MREIALDTETTGLDWRSDRIIEIGCVELFNHVATGVTFHSYINPKRDIAVEAFNVHGISEEFLADKPVFGAVAEAFSAFIGDSSLVIHNAAFDMGFLNSEFDRIGFGKFPPGRAIDTLMIARRKFPGGQNSLDGLCKRFNIDTSLRTQHGALIDAQLLAEVYLELVGGRQSDLGLVHDLVIAQTQPAGAGHLDKAARVRPQPLLPLLTEQERLAHDAFVASLKGDPVWNR